MYKLKLVNHIPGFSMVAHSLKLLRTKPVYCSIVDMLKAESFVQLLWLPLQVLNVLQCKEASACFTRPIITQQR